MHDDPQTLARGMVVEVDHPAAGPVKALGLPIKLSDTPGGVHGPAPRLGEHTAEVLAEHGFSPEDISGMIAAKAIISVSEP
jgi:crotonobetainyl-CoA:carnitine CoA-transferase CaiB-like acyl-CoA transferase